jgi:hypothetical protein
MGNEHAGQAFLGLLGELLILIGGNGCLEKFKGTFGAAEVPVRIYYFEKLPTVAVEARCYEATKQTIRTGIRSPASESPSGTTR